jgi:hypothetical protein
MVSATNPHGPKFRFSKPLCGVQNKEIKFSVKVYDCVAVSASSLALPKEKAYRGTEYGRFTS